MRGESSGQHDAFSYVGLEERIPKDHPLRTIRVRADKALKRLSPVFEEMYAGTGRPSIPPERLLKAQLLIALYSVRSDRQFCESLSWNLLHRTWAQRLRRVFAIEVEVCRRCGGRLQVIASIEDPAIIERILEHLGRDGGTVDPAHPRQAKRRRRQSRAPPEVDRLI